MQENIDKFYEKLPKEFKRDEAEKLAFKMKLSTSWLYQNMQKLLLQKRIKRISRGFYQKL